MISRYTGIHANGAANRAARTLFLVQTKGSALTLYALMYASMCCSSCLRLVKEAPLSDCPCKIENHTSTWLSQDELSA
jgi:hypothetical protein